MTNSTTTTTSVAGTASAEQATGYINATVHGWAKVLRVRTVKSARKSEPDTLHAFIAFNGGDGVDCKISGTDAKKLFLQNDLESRSQAGDLIEVQCTVGDCYSDTYQKDGQTVATRKGRLIDVSQLLITGESKYDDGGPVYNQTTMKASGFLRSARRYSKEGVQTDAVTIQFVHGKKGELNSDSHGLDVIDPALIDLLSPVIDKAVALNPDYDPTVEGSKKYQHSVWVSTTAVDCSSKLYIGKDKKTYVGRQGTLQSISHISVDGALVYSAKLEREAQAAMQVAAESDADTQIETAQVESVQVPVTAKAELDAQVATTVAAESEADF
jgi:hypothetical protein